MPVRRAQRHQLARLPPIGAAAGELFRSIADPRIARCADDPPWTVAELEGFLDDGALWLATAVDADAAADAADDDDAIVGFLAAEIIDGCAHVEDISVDPAHERRGHGSALLQAVAAWAAGAGMPAVTLTTFRDVPWNAPFYARRGYRVVREPDLSPGLAERRAEEATHGLDPTLRVVMRRDVEARADLRAPAESGPGPAAAAPWR